MSSDVSSDLLFDVTQYVNWPARTGIQRVMACLVRTWQGTAVQPRYGYIEDGRYVVGPLIAFSSFIGKAFARPGVSLTSADVRTVLKKAAITEVPTSAFEDVFGAYLLPEATLQEETLDVVSRLLEQGRIPVFILYYDALPLTKPWFYPTGADIGGTVTRYHQLVAQAEHIAFISTVTREVLESRLGRRRVRNGLVAPPGADGLPRVSGAPGEVPSFTVLGTVEPRKGHRAVLDAFERLWAVGGEHRLTLVGAPGWEDKAFITRIDALARSGRLEWLSAATDHEMAAAISRSWGAIYVPSAEGYGLPPLEALALGTPVIVSTDLPSLSGLPKDGQIRLDEITPETVSRAVEKLSDPARNHACRTGAAGLSLPTWEDFVRTLEGWVNKTIAAAGQEEPDT